MIIIENEDIIYKKEYPKFKLIREYSIFIIGYIFLIYLVDGLRSFHLIFFIALILFLYVTKIQFEYKILTIKSRQFIINYPWKLFKRTIILETKQIELIKYKPVALSPSIPYLKICMKYGNEYKLSFPEKDDIMQIIVRLKSLNYSLEKIS